MLDRDTEPVVKNRLDTAIEIGERFDADDHERHADGEPRRSEQCPGPGRD
jgi:hypothetical protein